jgi:hypothetical protein
MPPRAHLSLGGAIPTSGRSLVRVTQRHQAMRPTAPVRVSRCDRRVFPRSSRGLSSADTLGRARGCTFLSGAAPPTTLRRADNNGTAARAQATPLASGPHDRHLPIPTATPSRPAPHARRSQRRPRHGTAHHLPHAHRPTVASPQEGRGAGHRIRQLTSSNGTHRSPSPRSPRGRYNKIPRSRRNYTAGTEITDRTR